MKTAAAGFDLWAEHRGSTYGLDKTDYSLGAGGAAMWLGGGFGVFPTLVVLNCVAVGAGLWLVGGFGVSFPVWYTTGWWWWLRG